MNAENNRILITGAAGAIGSALRAGLRSVYGLLRLSDIRPLARPSAGEQTIEADIIDFESVSGTMNGIVCGLEFDGDMRRIDQA